MLRSAAKTTNLWPGTVYHPEYWNIDYFEKNANGWTENARFFVKTVIITGKLGDISVLRSA